MLIPTVMLMITKYMKHHHLHFITSRAIRDLMVKNSLKKEKKEQLTVKVRQIIMKLNNSSKIGFQ